MRIRLLTIAMEDKCYASAEQYNTRVGANAESESEDGNPNEGLADFNGLPTSDCHTTMVFCTMQVG